MLSYEKEFEKIVATVKVEKDRGNTSSLLLHSCCAPCSSYVMEYMRAYFGVTVFYYNPNITKEKEYQLRKAEQITLIAKMNAQEGIEKGIIHCKQGTYEPEIFFQLSKGLEQCKEGGERCHACFRQRLLKTAEEAELGGYDYFTTTLTISPMKNAKILNDIGRELEKGRKTKWLPSDFKKKNGYKRSVELSAQYGLYRQNYCGCIYSEAENKLDKREQ